MSLKKYQFIQFFILIIGMIGSSMTTYFVSQAGQNAKISDNQTQITINEQSISGLCSDLSELKDNSDPTTIALIINDYKHLRKELNSFVNDYNKNKEKQDRFYRQAAAKLGFTFE